MSADWERKLKEGLDGLSDLGTEEPPTLAELQMLVLAIQREQRQQLVRDLTLFLLCAISFLGLAFYVVASRPIFFLVWQGGAVVALLVAALYWGIREGRVVR